MHTTAAFDVTRSIDLAAGTIRYRDIGSGPVLVFVHGIFASGMLWHDVVSLLADHYRCIVPDLPLGAHSEPLLPHANRTPVGIAALLADFLAALDLHDVTLVGNDTGGAICQLCVTQHPARITRLVLTNCDAYEAFFPLLIRPFTDGARVFGLGFGTFLARVLRFRIMQRLLVWPVSHRGFDAATLDAIFAPFLANKAVQRDITTFLAAVSKRDTLAAAAAFGQFRHPVLIAWGADDRVFARYARRLARDFPDATLTFIPGSRAFVPVDQPQQLATRIAAFVGVGAGVLV